MGSVIGSYLGTFGTGAFGLTVAVAAYVGLMNQWCKPVGNFTVGIFGDRFGPTKVILFLNVILTAIAVFFIFLPKNSSMMIAFILVMAVEITLTGAFRGQMYAPMRECRVPMNLTGSAIGFYATLIYATDAILPPFIGKWLDTLPMEIAWRNIFILLAVFGVVGIVSCMIFIARNKNTIAEVRKEETEARRLAKEMKKA